MSKLVEAQVSKRLSKYFMARGLVPLGKHSPFSHANDRPERSFQIDLAIGPICSLGERTPSIVEKDRKRFQEASGQIDLVIEELRQGALFPSKEPLITNSCWEACPNPNPVYGVAIEIENSSTKYFLGSLLAASIAGRWGMMVVPACVETDRWIATAHRMMHKGAPSPIPSNILIFSWPTLRQTIDTSLAKLRSLLQSS